MGICARGDRYNGSGHTVLGLLCWKPIARDEWLHVGWLNNLGNDGWELTGMITERGPINREATDDIVPKQYTHLFFKRPLEE